VNAVEESVINRRAPIILLGELEVRAGAETVWQLLAGIPSWPDWNPEVKSATLEGELAAGSVFRWRAGGASLVSRLVAVEPPRKIAWTGKGAGVRVVHVYRLEPQDGGTLVQTEESVEGILARLLRGFVRSRMDAAIQAGLRSLKAAAERGAEVPARGAVEQS
jgi:hypothetical protein